MSQQNDDQSQDQQAVKPQFDDLEPAEAQDLTAKDAESVRGGVLLEAKVKPGKFGGL